MGVDLTNYDSICEAYDKGQRKDQIHESRRAADRIRSNIRERLSLKSDINESREYNFNEAVSTINEVRTNNNLSGMVEYTADQESLVDELFEKNLSGGVIFILVEDSAR